MLLLSPSLLQHHHFTLTTLSPTTIAVVVASSHLAPIETVAISGASIITRVIAVAVAG